VTSALAEIGLIALVIAGITWWLHYIGPPSVAGDTGQMSMTMPGRGVVTWFAATPVSP
jgi:hypothetical protein